MHAFYADNFDREVACTETEWLEALPRAMGDHAYRIVARALVAHIGGGQLALSWRDRTPRPGAPVPHACLLVSFRFTGVDDAHRYGFLKHFDLHMPRGGGQH